MNKFVYFSFENSNDIVEKDAEKLNLNLKTNKLEEFLLNLYRLRTVISGGLYLGNLNELDESLKEIKDNFGVEEFSVKIHDRVGLKKEEKNKILKEVKEKIKVNQNSEALIRVIIEKETWVFFDLIGKKDLSKRYYVFFNKEHSNPVLIQQAIQLLSSKIKEVNKIAFLKCKLGITTNEYLIFKLNYPGAFKRRDLFFLKFFELKEKLEKIDEKVNEKNKRLNEELYCLNDASEDVDLARKTARIMKFEDFIHFSRTDLFWIDWKFEEKEIDLLFSEINNEKDLEDYFYQATYVSRYFALLTNKTLESETMKWAKKYKTDLLLEREIGKFKLFLFKS